MSKKAGRRRRPHARRGKRLGRGVVIALVLSLATAGATLALWKPSRPAPGLTAATAVAPTQGQGSFSPANPAKEYVYAGGRLVATEEPVGTPPNAPTNLREGLDPQIHLPNIRWDDNSNNEAGFKIEVRYFTGNSWTLWSQTSVVGQNVTTYLPDYADCRARYFRVRATNAAGDSAYTNDHFFENDQCGPAYGGNEGAGCTPPTSLIITEFRLRGTAGSEDEFVELHNNSDSPVTVCTADRSGAWTLAARSADGLTASVVFTVSSGTVIPARGHYLGVNSGYSLTSYPSGNGTTATGDATYADDIADNAGVALFLTANPNNFTAAYKRDAVGFSGATGATADLYREGAGLAPVGTQNGQYSFVRRLANNAAQDTNDNAADWVFIATDAGTFGGSVQAKLGAPGPENLASPVQRNAALPLTVIDPAVAASQPPNRVRDFTSDPANNSILGTLSIRRRVTNNTGVNVTRLRFRITGMTTFPVPADTADLRARSSNAVQVTRTDGSVITVQGTTIEAPPAQPHGGGWNSTFSAGTISLAQPLAPGASVDVQFLLGIQQNGGFNFFINVEALP